MHELGVVFYIIKDVKAVAVENKVEKIDSVTVEIGEVSSVIPYYLKDCWEWAVHKEEGPIHDAKLVVETIPAVTYCENCHKEYPTVKYGKECPYCKDNRTYLLTGNEVNIKEIQVF
ncbi:MAG: hydrogenase maturation nickel metallochaperone HypA [Lachnospiraceae bacterium]|jgi:hydrogenase nickel incorporation protein HypA/HybF|nr:hydrogenase maturation nickel metallochaperone HypA [Lachnospiraceae bacterium]MBO7386553.1 hydrogenase maturation nickel metallochaperone HypA [Lachnospiraceae bacterium]MBP5298854.1 hydrogenase maturation nickel metallochaperone HypA [Lachnospiraceae bacterium]SDA69537.1 hydrogenase nickel incorporation protein HypA/HybF [Lachnospiraceae bacterium G11]